MISKQNVISWIENPLTITDAPIEALRELRDMYPYCEMSHWMYLRKLRISDDIHLDQELMNSAMHISNRRSLHNFLHYSEEKNEISINDIAPISDYFGIQQSSEANRKSLQELAAKLKAARMANKVAEQAKADVTPQESAVKVRITDSEREEMAKKLNIKKGDTVRVIAGNDKGHTGKVQSVLVSENRAVVEGANMVSKATKPNAQNTQGGIIKKEAPIHISNLQLVDPKSGNPTRVGRREGADGKLVRYAKKSGEEIK